MESFAAHLRAVRRGALLSQQQIADRLDVDRSVYAMYETGKVVPSVRVLNALFDCCAVAPDEQRAFTAEAEA